jgi:zinc protease
LPKPTRDEVVNLSLTLRYGTVENLKGLREPASLLPSLMNRGTKNLTYQQLRDEMNKLDVQVSASSGGLGSLSLNVRARKSSLSAALDLLRQIAREPTLDAKELEILKQSRIANLEQSRTDPQSLARDLLTRTLSPYPADDFRFNAPPDEEIARVKAVTIEQIRKVYGEYLGGSNGELVIIGDFDPEPTLAKVGEILDGWQAAMPCERIPAVAFTAVAGGKHSILTPDKANATYSAGLTIALSDQDPDYPALLLGNYMFGGSSLASRLGDRVRQKEGLSYGVSSGFTANSEDKVARFSIGAICNPANIGKVESAVLEELQRFLKDGVTAEELDKAKRGYLQSRELSQSSEFLLANRLERGLRLDQTLAYEADLDAKLAALTPDDVLRALKKHIDPARLVIVIAGDFAKSAAP